MSRVVRAVYRRGDRVGVCITPDRCEMDSRQAERCGYQPYIIKSMSAKPPGAGEAEGLLGRGGGERAGEGGERMDGTTVEPDSEIKLVRVSGGLAWGMGSWAGGWGGTSRPLFPPFRLPLAFYILMRN